MQIRADIKAVKTTKKEDCIVASVTLEFEVTQSTLEPLFQLMNLQDQTVIVTAEAQQVEMDLRIGGAL